MTAPAERDRFHHVYRSNYDHVLGYALRRASGPDDAADAVAETFLIAWRKLDDVPEGDQTKPWLFGVTRRVLSNQRRSTRRRLRLAEHVRADTSRLFDEMPVVDDDAALVGAAMRRLSPDDRELLSLVAWEGLDHGEMAVALGCSRNAVRIRLHRARKRLAGELRVGGFEPARSGRVARLIEGTTTAKEG